MHNLHSFWDWVLFAVGIFSGMLAIFGILGISVSVLFLQLRTTIYVRSIIWRLCFIVPLGLLSYWLLWNHLGVF